MIRKLSEIPNLMLHKILIPDNDPIQSNIRGFNSAVDQQSSRQIEIVIDREKLAIEIYKITCPHLWMEYGFMQHYGDCPSDEACYAYKIADAIISQQDSIMEIRVVNK